MMLVESKAMNLRFRWSIPVVGESDFLSASHWPET